MKKIINSYRNVPGDHCGSVAMKNLLYFHKGLDLPEAVVFGLGAGIDLYVIDGKTPMISGRSASLETDACNNLGIAYSEAFDPDNDHAWEAVKKEVASGRPVMLTGDIFYLDYREFKYHFPAHRFVLVGFDDDKREAYIMDRIKETMEACSYKALRKSRNPDKGFSTFNLWGRFGESDEEVSLETSVIRALKMCSSRMLGIEQNNSMLMQGLRMRSKFEEGISAIRALTANFEKWSAADNFSEICHFNAENIEKFGNGGGLFRRLYGDFLEWTVNEFPGLIEPDVPELAVRSANEWSKLAELLSHLAGSGDDPATRRKADASIRSIALIEEQLFNTIRDSVGSL